MGGSPLPKEINIGEPAKEPTVETMEAVGTVGGGLNRHGLPGGLPYRYDFDSKGCRELSREAKSCYLEGWKACATPLGRRNVLQVPGAIPPFPMVGVSCRTAPVPHVPSCLTPEHQRWGASADRRLSSCQFCPVLTCCDWSTHSRFENQPYAGLNAGTSVPLGTHGPLLAYSTET